MREFERLWDLVQPGMGIRDYVSPPELKQQVRQVQLLVVCVDPGMYNVSGQGYSVRARCNLHDPRVRGGELPDLFRGWLAKPGREVAA